MKKTLLATLLLLSSLSYAQTDKFTEWLKAPEGELYKQKFAKKKLDKEDAKEASFIIDSLWLQESAKELRKQWDKLTISNDSLTLPCACRTFGMYPRDGRSLYISLHGGGECPKEVNDEQWMNQIYLYQVPEGIYVAPRAPWNTWNLWHRKGLDELFEQLIRACVVFEGVNPNKVYLMGYSAGGDGVWRMAPRMADKWAAAAMMAGHPGNSSQENLLNLPFTIWMGENDAAYDRNRLAKKRANCLTRLQQPTQANTYIAQTSSKAKAIGWTTPMQMLSVGCHNTAETHTPKESYGDRKRCCANISIGSRHRPMNLSMEKESRLVSKETQST